MVDLAVASANQWVEEAMWAIPVRFPPETAMALALSLAPEGTESLTDLRVAQLTLADALEAPGVTDASLAAQVLDRRTKRREQTVGRRLSEAEAGLESHRLARLEAEKDRAEALAREERLGVVAARSGKAAEQIGRELAWERRRSKRILVSAVLVAFGVATVTAAALTSTLWLTLVSLTLLMAVGYAAYRWCSKEGEGLVPALVGAILQVAAAVVTFADYVGLLPVP